MRVAKPAEQEVADRHGIGRTLSPFEGCGVGDAAIVGLGVGDIREPLFVKPVQTKIVERLLGPHGHVVKPAHAFVALRAVGGHAVKVARLGVNHGCLDAIEQIVAASETPVARHAERTTRMSSVSRLAWPGGRPSTCT